MRQSKNWEILGDFRSDGNPDLNPDGNHEVILQNPSILFFSLIQNINEQVKHNELV